MHRHAPKRHAVPSFVVAHEGCDRLGQETDDSGSGTPKHRFDRQHPKIEPVGSSHSHDRVPPLTSGTPKNHALTVNRDIDGPLPRLGSAPKRRRWWSPTEEIGWSRTQEIRWYPTQEIGWVRSEEILHDDQARTIRQPDCAGSSPSTTAKLADRRGSMVPPDCADRRATSDHWPPAPR